MARRNLARWCAAQDVESWAALSYSEFKAHIPDLVFDEFHGSNNGRG